MYKHLLKLENKYEISLLINDLTDRDNYKSWEYYLA